MPRVLIAGCGYVGTELGLRLAEVGHTVFGLRRRAGELPSPIGPVAADLTRPETLRELPRAIDVVVYTASTDAADEAHYRSAYVEGLAHLLEALRARGERPRRLLFTSSTGVYPQSGGEWVDEDSPATPTHFSGRVLLEAERTSRAAPFPATVVRLAGIYGPGRTTLVERVRQGEAVCHDGAPIWTNRIHRDDAAGILRHLIEAPDADDLYIGVDDEPADQCAVYRWIANRLGVPPPRVETRAAPDLRYGRSSNKRCRNRRIVASGYVFRYPTFRDGYGALIQEDFS